MNTEIKREDENGRQISYHIALNGGGGGSGIIIAFALPQFNVHSEIQKHTKKRERDRETVIFKHFIMIIILYGGMV